MNIFLFQILIKIFDTFSDVQQIIERKIGKALKTSGVAITVTSLTDFLAFAVGATTTVPALESFCFFCGLGIVVVYLYQITWFTAWLALDQRRMLSNRNACLPCLQVNSSQEVKTSNCFEQMEPMAKYADFLNLKPVKVIVILITMVGSLIFN